MRIGVDMGTAAVKVVIVRNRELLWHQVRPTVPGCGALAESMVADGLAELSSDDSAVESKVATGYGKDRCLGATERVDEITANAIGAAALSAGKAGAVINVGGQDSKVITLEPDGAVLDFRMNDKCAAGTGRFFELAGRILDLPVDRFDEMAARSNSPAAIDSTCAVFAETEIVSLISQGTSPEDIIAGLHQAVARRIASLTASLEMPPDCYFDGGVAPNTSVRRALEAELMVPLGTLPYPQFTVAYGAAIMD